MGGAECRAGRSVGTRPSIPIPGRTRVRDDGDDSKVPPLATLRGSREVRDPSRVPGGSPAEPAGAGLGLARVWVGAIEVTAATAAAGGGDPAGSVKNLRLNGPRNLSGFAPPICIFYATVQRLM